MEVFPIFMEMNEGVLEKLEVHGYIYLYIYIYVSYIYMMESPVQLLCIKKKKRGGKSINFLNQQKRLEEENSDYLLCLTKTQKFPPPFQDPGAPILTG